MKRINFYLSENQISKLKELARASGLSVSEEVRRAIDMYLFKMKKKGTQNET